MVKTGSWKYNLHKITSPNIFYSEYKKYILYLYNFIYMRADRYFIGF